MATDHLKQGRFWVRAAGSFVFRLACYDVMVYLALYAEARAAPSLPDLLIERVPFVDWVARYNYVLWLFAYVPVALWLLLTHGERFVRYMVSAGLLALVRGVSIVATGLGPVHGPDAHAGMSDELRWAAFQRLVTPLGFFDPSAGATVSLTKDLFFSGHTATTFLLLLYVWPWRKARAVMLAAHLLVVASVFFSHLHYTIDVIGAYAVTFALFVVREADLKALLSRFQS